MYIMIYILYIRIKNELKSEEI